MSPEEIRRAREGWGLSRTQLGELLGYAGSSGEGRGDSRRISVHYLEAGKRHLGGAALRLLEAYLSGYRPPDWPAPNEKPRQDGGSGGAEAV